MRIITGRQAIYRLHDSQTRSIKTTDSVRRDQFKIYKACEYIKIIYLKKRMEKIVTQFFFTFCLFVVVLGGEHWFMLRRIMHIKCNNIFDAKVNEIQFDVIYRENTPDEAQRVKQTVLF